MYCYVLKNSVRSSVQLVCQKTTRRGTRISLDNSHGRNATHIRTNFGRSLIRINEPRHSIICPSKRRESWSRFILSVTQEHFRSTPLALCTFYPLILSRFSTTSSHIITKVQYRSIPFALGSAEKTRQCCQSQSTESPTYFRPLPSFLSEVFDLPGVA